MTPVIFRPLQDRDRAAWIGLRQALWMGSDATTQAAADGTLLSEPRRFGALRYGVLLAVEAGRTVGFVEVSLRDDIEGLGGAPVGYIEGVYIEPKHQRRGLGRGLLDEAARWTRAQGATQLASDVLPDNPASLAFHEHSGFRRVGESGRGDKRQILLTRAIP
jgi:aminoglycoside 6'-N-acetyltransferase I